MELSDIEDSTDADSELCDSVRKTMTDNIAPMMVGRRQNKRRKSSSYVPLAVFFVVFSLIALPLVSENIKQGLITLISTAKSIFSRGNDKRMINISTDDNYIKDLSKQKLVEPMQVQQELAKSRQINKVKKAPNQLKEKKGIPDLNQSFTNEVSTGNNEYYVQVGAWRNSNHTEMLLLKIKKYYPKAYIVKQNDLNKIRIPSVLTKKQGAIVSEDLEDKFHVKPLLVLKKQ